MRLQPILLGVALFALAASFARQSGERETTWLSDLGEASLLAKKTGKPMLAVFR